MAPAVPKKLAKKSATKPPDKEAAKKGPKTPFAKPRKAPAVKVKQEEWTEERWQENCVQRKLSTAKRRERRMVEQARKTTASLLQQKVVLATCTTTTAASPWSCSTSVYILGVASPSTPGFFGEAAAATPGCLTPRLLPRYEDALAHGGFNPNVVLSPKYDEQQRQQGHDADGVAFTSRRGPLQFEGAVASFGKEEAAREEEDSDEDDEEDDDEEDEEEDAVEDAEDLVEVDATGVRKKKADSGLRGPK
nr:uncharacterized protein LOC127303288 [Lolium perenne]